MSGMNIKNNNSVKRKAISSNMRKCLLNPNYLTLVLEYYCNSNFVT